MSHESKLIRSACPVCDTVAVRETYDIGSGPELSCVVCEWCWGAEGQILKPLDHEAILADANLRLAQHRDEILANAMRRPVERRED